MSLNLSQLIAKLIDLEVEHGSLEVCAQDDDGFDTPITDVSVVKQVDGSDHVLFETKP